MGGSRALALVVLCIVLPVILGSLTRSSINTYAGPFSIIFKETTQCPDGTVSKERVLTNLTGQLHYSRSLKVTVFDGHWLVFRDIHPGDVGVKIEIAKWDNVAGWRDNFFRLDVGELCKMVLMYVKEVMSEIHRNNPQIPTGCPAQKGVYKVQNLSTAALSRYEHFPVFPYGRFRGDLKIYEMKSKEIVGCFRGTSDVVPKIKKS